MSIEPDTIEFEEKMKELADGMLMRDRELMLLPTLFEGVEKDYLMYVAGSDKYSHTPSEELEKGIEFIKFSWVGLVNGKRGGVVFIAYLENLGWWTLDAYKDDDALKGLRGDFSHRAGQLVLDWFFREGLAKEIHTIHRVENRAATLACKRLGFEEKSKNPQFICLIKRGP